MEQIIAEIILKADACSTSTKESRARKGAYVDCIMMLKQALGKTDVIGRSGLLLKRQSDWLMSNTSVEVEKIIDFVEHFKQ